MTIVGSQRMIVYDDVVPLEKIRIFDTRVEHPPHYDTFADFQYAYHYGDMYAPYVQQEEPLKRECQNFLDSIKNGIEPITSGRQGLDLVRILEASSLSLSKNGCPIYLDGNSDEGGDCMSSGEHHSPWSAQNGGGMGAGSYACSAPAGVA
jgi:predicted dehydrogenase